MPTGIFYIAGTMKQGPRTDCGESRLRSAPKIAGGSLSGGGSLGGPSLYSNPSEKHSPISQSITIPSNRSCPTKTTAWVTPTQKQQAIISTYHPGDLEKWRTRTTQNDPAGVSHHVRALVGSSDLKGPRGRLHVLTQSGQIFVGCPHLSLILQSLSIVIPIQA